MVVAHANVSGNWKRVLQTLASLLQEKQLNIFSKAQNEGRQSDVG